MKEIEVFQYTTWQPLSSFGFAGTHWHVNGETVISTWIVLAILMATAIGLRALLKKQHLLASYIVCSFVRYFMELVHQSLGAFHANHFAFVTSLFMFILYCNALGAFLPGLEEPTSDLNTTLALALIAFFYIQFYSIKKHGFGGYLKEYFSPFAIMFPLNLVSKCATIISLSFRLFGNIFGGSIIAQIYQSARTSSIIAEVACLATGLNLLMTGFFGLFEGIIQAFVFAMITLTYLALGIQEEGSET